MTVGAVLQTLSQQILLEQAEVNYCWEILVDGIDDFGEPALDALIESLSQGQDIAFNELSFESSGEHVTVSFLERSGTGRRDLFLGRLTDLRAAYIGRRRASG